MQIHTYYYYEDGPWISFTEGHVDIEKFREEALQDVHVKSVIDDFGFTEKNWHVKHGYIRQLDDQAALEATGEPDFKVYEDCGEDDAKAKPITAIYWDYKG